MGKLNTMALLSIVFAFILFPLGLIFGIIALKQIKRTDEEGKGLAVVGIVISLIPFAVFLFMTFLGLGIGFFRAMS